MKKAVSLLPEDYKEIYAIDLQKNKKMSLLVNLAAVLILLVMAIPMHFYCSVFTLFNMSKGLLQYALRYSRCRLRGGYEGVFKKCGRVRKSQGLTLYLSPKGRPLIAYMTENTNKEF